MLLALGSEPHHILQSMYVCVYLLVCIYMLRLQSMYVCVYVCIYSIYSKT